MITQEVLKAKGVAKTKIILSGEHSVLFGEPVISIPFASLETQVMIEPGCGQIYIDSSIYRGELYSSPESLKGIKAGIAATMNYLGHPMRDMVIRIESSVPTGRGLGSSSSVAVAIVRALFNYAGQTCDRETVLYFAEEIESISHGKSSGIDPITVLSDHPVWYRKGFTVDHVHIKDEFHFLLVDSGKKSETKHSVEIVKSFLERDLKQGDKIIKKIGSLTRKVKDALESGDKYALGRLLNENHSELAKLGVSDPVLDKLVCFSREQGAFGAKLTGSGNGGCVIVLARNADYSDVLSGQIKDLGFQVWPFKVEQ